MTGDKTDIRSISTKVDATGSIKDSAASNYGTQTPIVDNAEHKSVSDPAPGTMKGSEPQEASVDLDIQGHPVLGTKPADQRGASFSEPTPTQIVDGDSGYTGHNGGTFLWGYITNAILTKNTKDMKR